MILDCTHERIGCNGFIKPLTSIGEYIYCDEIANIFARNLIFIGFINFLWFQNIHDVSKMDNGPGIYLFLTPGTREIMYCGYSENVRQRVTQSHEKYQNDYIIVIPTRKKEIAKRLETIFIPLFDCKRNRVKLLHGKRGRRPGNGA